MARKKAESDSATPKRVSKSPKSATKTGVKQTSAPKARTTKTVVQSESDEAPVKGGRVRDLVIVESPKKAKSINKFLGSGFIVKASMGHVRDLPKRKIGVDVANGFEPTYEIMPGKKETVDDLRKEANRARMVYMATDPDREGEAIAWHLQAALGVPDERVRRVKFYEITEKAVKEAFNHASDIDIDKVNAQQARRFLDRFVGYELSPLLWKKVTRNLSAGRVQSVAVRLIAEREKEVAAFVSEEYWKVTATLALTSDVAKQVALALSKQKSHAEEVEATDDDEIVEARPKYELPEFAFDTLLTEWQGKSAKIANEEQAKLILETLTASQWSVGSVEQEDRLDRPDAPFKTSTLQQQAAIRLRWSGKKTMNIAQEL